MKIGRYEIKALALLNEVLSERELPIKLQMCPLSNSYDAAIAAHCAARKAD